MAYISWSSDFARGKKSSISLVQFLHTPFFFMVGPWCRILPQWLRVPGNGSGPAICTRYVDGRTLGQISTPVVKGARQREWPRHLSTHNRAQDLTHNVRTRGPIRYTSQLCIPHAHKHACTYTHSQQIHTNVELRTWLTPLALSMQMVGPWGRYLPLWLRAPGNGSGPAV